MSANGGNTGASLADDVHKVGIGYSIAIAVAILVLISAIILASYLCLRINGRGWEPNTGGRGAAAGLQQDRVPEQGTGEWSSGSLGLDQATLDSYPRLVYSEKQSLPLPGDASCSICLAEYKHGEVLKLLPDCCHVFHTECIDAWLRRHASCPMCRSSALPTPQTTPGSTPLSELIPLARNALNIGYTIHHNV